MRIIRAIDRMRRVLCEILTSFFLFTVAAPEIIMKIIFKRQLTLLMNVDSFDNEDKYKIGMRYKRKIGIFYPPLPKTFFLSPTILISLFHPVRSSTEII